VFDTFRERARASLQKSAVERKEGELAVQHLQDQLLVCSIYRVESPILSRLAFRTLYVFLCIYLCIYLFDYLSAGLSIHAGRKQQSSEFRKDLQGAAEQARAASVCAARTGAGGAEGDRVESRRTGPLPATHPQHSGPDGVPTRRAAVSGGVPEGDAAGTGDNRWMDGCIDRWMDGWVSMDRWIDE